MPTQRIPLLAATLLLTGCAHPASLLGVPASRAIALDLHAATPYAAQATVHRWVGSDVHEYRVQLLAWNGSAYVPLNPDLTLVVPNGASPRALYGNLRTGSRYRVTANAWGSVGGGSATTLLNTTPASIDFDFTGSQDVSNAATASLQLALNGVPFSGMGSLGLGTAATGSLVTSGAVASAASSTSFEIATIAGPTGSSTGFQDGTGSAARFYSPLGAALGSAGLLYVADRDNHRIRTVSAAGVVSTFAGSGTAGLTNGSALSATFNGPSGIALDATGSVYVADTKNQRIRLISGGTVSTLAGNGTRASVDGAASSASFMDPVALVVDAAGTVYVADSGGHRIRKISGGTVTTFAGSGTAGSTDGATTSASFNAPTGLALDLYGNLYVADSGNHRIRRITPAGVVSTWAGSTAGIVDGATSSAKFNTPTSVAVDGQGRLVVTDKGNARIRLVVSGQVSTLGGSGTTGILDGPASVARFDLPYGIAADLANGYFYVTEASASCIRVLR